MNCETSRKLNRRKPRKRRQRTFSQTCAEGWLPRIGAASVAMWREANPVVHRSRRFNSLGGSQLDGLVFRALLVLLICTQAGQAVDLLDTWTWRNPVPPPTLVNIAYDDGQFVGVGVYGAIATSTDGVIWVMRQSGTSQHLNAVAIGNGQFVAVGDTILTSNDGVKWIERSAGNQKELRRIGLSGIVYGGGQFVAVGGDMDGHPVILTSSSGTDWTARKPATPGALSAITHGNGLFVALGNPGTILTSVDGVNWTERQSGTKHNLASVTYGNHRFVAVGGSGTIVTSADAGTTWIRRGLGTTNFFRGIIAYGGGQFAAIGAHQPYGRGNSSILTSADGANWVQRWSANNTYIEGIAYGGGRFAAVSRTCDGRGCFGFIVTSADGVNWVKQQTVGQYSVIAYGNGRFVAAGRRDGSGLLTSSDGVNWVERTSASLWGWSDHPVMVYARDHFVALGIYRGGETSGTSLDGVNWVQHQWPSENVPAGIAFGNGRFVAIGSGDGPWGSGDSRGKVQISKDGLNWTLPRSIAPRTLRAVAFGGGYFVAVGYDGTILQSGSIINLEIRPAPGTGLLSLSLEGPAELGYTIQISSDLISWRDAIKISNAASNKIILEGLPAASDRQFYRAISP